MFSIFKVGQIWVVEGSNPNDYVYKVIEFGLTPKVWGYENTCLIHAIKISNYYEFLMKK